MVCCHHTYKRTFVDLQAFGDCAYGYAKVFMAEFLCSTSPYTVVCASAVTQYSSASLQCPAGQVCTNILQPCSMCSFNVPRLQVIVSIPYADFGTVTTNSGCGNFMRGVGVPTTSASCFNN